MKIKEEVIKVKEVIKERKYYYLIGYIAGYAVTLMASGIPNKLYLIPVKLWGVICAIGVGNALYYGSKGGLLPHRRLIKFLKYMVMITVVVIIFSLIQKLFLNLGIDINFLL